MILDKIDNLNRYNLPLKEKILQFLKSRDAQTVPDGEHEIDGRNLFVRVMSGPLKPAAENKFETHRAYADLQYVASGVELMQVAPNDLLKSITPYDKEGDFEFYQATDAITDLVVRAGEFTIFYPGEAHRPSCLYRQAPPVYKKLVFKIKI